MAKNRILLIVFLLFLLVEMEMLIETTTAAGVKETEIAARRVKGIDCRSKCDYRCSKASRHKMCVKACNTCCERCDCVPPGTSANKEVCPCYANMKTHGGRPKCP